MARSFTPEFFMVPFHMAQKLGIEKAMLLERLKQWQEYTDAQEWNPDEDGRFWFYHTRKTLQDETTLGEWQLKQYIKEFRDRGFIKAEQRNGFDRKTYFWVDRDHPIFSRNLPSPSGGNLPIDQEETSACMGRKPPHASGGNLPMAPTFRERDQEKETNKERHFCAAENPPSQPPSEPPIFNSPEPTQTPNQLVQATENEASKQRGGLEPSREESTQLIPSKNVQMENKGDLIGLKQSRVVSEGNDKPNTTTEVWNAYSQAYGQRYKGPGGVPIQPPRNARTNQVCKKLVDQYGFQVAIGLVNFIFYSKDAYIIRNTHSLLAPNDACWQSLYTQMMSGQIMTQTKATQEDKMGALDDVATRAIQRWSKIERERNEKR